MGEKKEIKISLTTFFLIIAIIIMYRKLLMVSQ